MHLLAAWEVTGDGLPGGSFALLRRKLVIQDEGAGGFAAPSPRLFSLPPTPLRGASSYSYENGHKWM